MESTTQVKSANQLLENLDLNTTGIIWTPTELTIEGNELVYELDYFFDGTISSGIHHHGMEKDFSLFSTNNFGNDLKLGLISNNYNFESNLKTLLALISRPTNQFKVLFIQNKIDKSLEKTVEKSLSKYKNSMLQKLYF